MDNHLDKRSEPGSLIDVSLMLLGLTMTDRITGFSGVVSSVCFDLYGCVQVALAPPAKDGKIAESFWFDIKRVASSGERVMDAPDFAIPIGREPGPAEKPRRMP